MALTIGQTIKKLRKDRNLTQEELAEQLGVTYQAVSKWENEAGLPDISQVVPLASVFGVSTDVLFGTFGINDDEEIKKITDELSEKFKNNLNEFDFESQKKEHEWFYKSLTELLKRYPNNAKLLYQCISIGTVVVRNYRQANDSRADEVFKECVREANLIIRHSKDIAIVMNTHMLLVRLYSQFGEYEKATEHANMFPDDFEQCRGSQLAWIKRASNNTDEELKQRCNNMFSLFRALEFEIHPLGNIYYKKKQYKDAIRVYKSVFDIISAVYGDEEYTPPLHITGNLHVRIAACYWKLDDADSAFSWIEKMIKLHTTNKKYYNNTNLETPLLRECEFKFFAKSYAAKDHILNDLNWFSDDDGIRKTERFKALTDRANALED